MLNTVNNSPMIAAIYLLGYRPLKEWRTILEPWMIAEKIDQHGYALLPDQVWAMPAPQAALMSMADYPLVQTLTIVGHMCRETEQQMLVSLQTTLRQQMPDEHWWIRSRQSCYHRETANYSPEQLTAIQQLSLPTRSAALNNSLGGTRWMGIINATPDSFSDGGVNNDLATLRASAQTMLAAGVSIIDLGGQSTRPGADILNVDDEWQRVAPAIDVILEAIASWPFAVDLSIDTYHPEIARRAIERGATMINDVDGLNNPEMRALIREYPQISWIAMHHLGLPVNKATTLPEKLSPAELIATINQWGENLLQTLSASHNRPATLYLDPGIGFGKTAKQNALILQHCYQLSDSAPWLIGHSRKSYLAPLLTTKNRNVGDRDIGTIATSISLIQQRCPVIRVHNIAAARLAERSFLATFTPSQ